MRFTGRASGAVEVGIRADEKLVKVINDVTLTRGAFWTSAVFYGLLAMEFFYMVSPFAAYIYGVYGPGLKALNLSGSTSWLIAFFMPHIARETRSLPISLHEAIGAVILLIGLTGFTTGAVQIYRSKLTRKGAVVGGVYRHIRHPQYLALMTASFGMLLIWPRYLVLFGFVTICFAYHFLARMEERICSRKFPGYDIYRARTGMFLPRRFEYLFSKMPWPEKAGWRAMSMFGFYVAMLLTAFAAAKSIRTYAVNSLYTYSTGTEIYLSLGCLSPDFIGGLGGIARADQEVRARLVKSIGPGDRMINYVMPAEIFVSEVPMYIPEGAVTGHRLPGKESRNRFKIDYTKAHFGPGKSAEGLDILRRALNKSPIVEVWIDHESQRVERVLDPPLRDFYDGMPVPVF